MSREAPLAVTASGGGGSTGVCLVQAGGAAKHPAGGRTSPPSKNRLPPDVSGAGAEKPCNEGRKPKFCALGTSQHRRQGVSPDIGTGRLKL